MARLIRTNYPPRLCQECGASYIPIRSDQLFCSVNRPRCKDVSHSRQLKRAWEVYRELYAHVSTSDATQRGATLSAVMRQARVWRDEDRSKGVPPPPPSERMKIEATHARYTEHLANAKRMAARKGSATL